MGSNFNEIWFVCGMSVTAPLLTSSLSDIGLSKNVYTPTRVQVRMVVVSGVFCLYRFTDSDINMGHLNNPGAKPAVFCFKNLPEKR